MSNSRLILRAAVFWIAIGCAWWACATMCEAQDLRYLSQQAWSTEEGLPQSSVHSIAQTRDGYLWVATESGLARFDGLGFRVFDHTTDHAFLSDDICCLVEDGENGLLVGTADGLIRVTSGGSKRFGVADGWSDGAVLSLTSNGDGHVSIETAKGTLQWSGAGFRAVETNRASPHEMRGPDGAVWSYETSWVAVVHGDVKRTWKVGKDLASGRIQMLYLDQTGLAWVGMNNGLFVLDSGEVKAKAVALIGANSVLSTFEDAEGNHWIGTETSGLHILRRLTFRGEAELADKAITAVVQTIDGAMWVGTRADGLRQVRNGVVEEPVKENALTSPVILCEAPGARGGLWVGTPDGLNFIDARNHVRKISSGDGLPDDYVRSLAAGADGSIWVGTQHGLVHLDGTKVKTLSKGDGLGGDVIGSLLMTRRMGASALWVGTSGGLSRVDGEGKVTNFTTKDGLGSNIVTAMAEDGQGSLWAATNDGRLSLFDGRSFTATGALQGGESVEGMRFDGNGFLWLRMDRGISRVSVGALHACVINGRCADGVVTRYGVADGLPNGEVVSGGSATPWLGTNDEMWFATRGGVAVVDTVHLPTSDAVPVVIQRLLVDDVSMELGSMPTPVAYGHLRLTVEFAGLSFKAPAAVHYRFRLENFDKNWVDGGSRRSASYTNLPPGNYVFQAEAAAGDGKWGLPSEVRFKVVPPFYRRWWFLTLLGVVVVACLGGGYLLRLRWLRRRFDAVLAERNRMAREIHDTLTQDFVGTSLQLDIISQQLARGKTEMAIEQVRRTRQLVADGLTEARQSIWELRANNSQDSLPTRLTRIVQRDTFAALSAKLHVGGAYRALDPRVEREVLRVAQEALSNMVHHARATEAIVELHYSSDTLMLMLEDNGVGFSMDEAMQKTGHFGLLGMRERAATIDGVLDIVSEQGTGTRITLRVPTAAGRGQR